MAGERSTVDRPMLDSFQGIVFKVSAMMAEDSPSMPELEGTLTALIEREGGPQFKYLFEQVVG
ncbi:MAG: hypothetical protein HZC29_02755 [Thaumarchaeota archaeon]|nr:hypothetical protein [Nitrososphaerota archaeon]